MSPRRFSNSPHNRPFSLTGLFNRKTFEMSETTKGRWAEDGPVLLARSVMMASAGSLVDDEDEDGPRYERDAITLVAEPGRGIGGWRFGHPVLAIELNADGSIPDELVTRIATEHYADILHVEVRAVLTSLLLPNRAV